MPNRSALLALLAASMLVAGLPGTPTPVAAASCSGWSSEAQPPPVIRVLRTATGAVETVDFRAYVANVLSREWISSWSTESIRAGALVVKHYAWFRVLNWRGYTNASGACFDVFDSTRDQLYDPTRPTHGPMSAAVDVTWATLALRNGRIFAPYYSAGATGEACGANANGWQMFQWGSQACGLAGRSAAQILATYYPGVQVLAAPPPAPPPATPRPTPTPVPTSAVPTPTAESTAAPPSTPSPPAAATPVPTPAPTTVAVRAPQPIEQPGGGQQIVTPPPLPPADPAPVIVTPEVAAADGPLLVDALSVPIAAPTPEAPAIDRRSAWRGPSRWASAPARGTTPTAPRIDARLAAFTALWSQRVDALLAALAPDDAT